jgi:hypothetical protein
MQPVRAHSRFRRQTHYRLSNHSLQVNLPDKIRVFHNLPFYRPEHSLEDGLVPELKMIGHRTKCNVAAKMGVLA